MEDVPEPHYGQVIPVVLSFVGCVLQSKSCICVLIGQNGIKT